MTIPDENGWFEIGDDMTSIPNDCFDIIAKYYDAGLDQMMMVRLPGCVRVDDRVLWAPPFPGRVEPRIDVIEFNYRPTHWAPLPKPPVSP